MSVSPQLLKLCFVSLSVKAIHLELVSDMKSEAFIVVLICFIAHSGKPSYYGAICPESGRMITCTHIIFIWQLNSCPIKTLVPHGCSYVTFHSLGTCVNPAVKASCAANYGNSRSELPTILRFPDPAICPGVPELSTQILQFQ